MMLMTEERPETTEKKPKKTMGLTHAQKRIWYTDKINENSCISNIAMFVNFNEPVDRNFLGKAINITLYKNDGLRLRFLESDNEAVQYISDYVEKTFEIFDFSSDRDGVRLKQWLGENAGKPFDLTDSDMFRFHIVKLPGNRTGLFVNTHHIISDGWTAWLIQDEIRSIYQQLNKGEPIDSEKNPSYVDYIVEESAFLSSPGALASKEYWHKKLQSPPEYVDLSFTGKKAADSKASSITFEFSPVLREKIHRYMDKYRSSRYSVLLTALAVYASGVSGQKDICIAGFSHNRVNRQQKKMTGMFVSSFPLMLSIDRNLGFRAAEEAGNRELKNVLKYGAKYPFDLIVSELRQEKGIDVSGLLNLGLVGHPDIRDDSASVDYVFSGEDDIPLSIHENVENSDIHGVMKITFNYNVNLFTQRNIATLFHSLENILESAMDDPQLPLSRISLVRGDERKRILEDFNRTGAEFPKDKTLHELFEEKAAKTPHKTAVVYRDIKITYDELNRQANRLAFQLQKQGVGKDQPVAILADRSAHIIVAMLGVLKAGGAYAPIDPEYPPERIKYILEDSGAGILLTKKEIVKNLEFNGRILYLEDESIYEGEADNPPPASGPENLAYVIYTSGSTGRPKGVMVEHHSVVNYICWHRNYYNIDETYNCAAHGSFSFDSSVPQIYSPLLSGAELHIIDSDIRLSPVELNDYFEKNNINHADLPTQFAEQFMTTVRNNSLKSVTTGGEKLKYYKKRNYKLVDEYGPTEYTVTATYFHIDRFYEKTPIGKPVNNTRVYILDKYNNLQPVGIPGELCLAGEGLARGYLGKPELTAERFAEDPFCPGKRMYRTGDLARWLPDGNVDFIGRKDFQVKIRGYRVELGEIENALLSCEGIEDGVVLCNTAENGNDYLSAHIVLKDTHITIKDARFRIVTCAQDPAQKDRMEAQHIGSWQDFFQGDEVNVKYWKKLYRVFPDYQFALLDGDNDIAALGNMIPLCWDGTKENLPAGWDDAVVRGFEDNKNGKAPNTVCVLAGVVNKKYGHMGFGYEIVKIMAKIVDANGIRKFILPVRPNLKEKYPLVDLEKYLSMKNEKGETFDNWVRVHEKLGGEIIGLCPESQYIEGTIAQWEEWSGRKFETGGEQIVKGAMQPVFIDLENNRGTYYDPAVWITHDPPKYASIPVNILNPHKIKEHLARYLPDYMIPSKYCFMDSIPVNAHGKVDHNALRAAMPAEDHQADYIPPSTDREKILAEIWKSIFKSERIGIHDNFFSLGGDSIISIQAVARARDEGLNLSVKQLYGHPTIAELARIAERTVKTIEDQGPATGEAELLPVQRWFFEKDFVRPSHFNQAFLFELISKIDVNQVKKILSFMVQYHDSLRFRYELSRENKWIQTYSADGNHFYIKTFDLGEIKKDKQPAFIENCCTVMQGSLDIQRGPLMAAGLFEGAADGKQRLLIAIHHLAVDMVSWRILMGDFRNLYYQLLKGREFQLPPKTASYRKWGNGLIEYAGSKALEDQLDFWLDMGKNASPFSFDRNCDSYSMEDIVKYEFTVDRDLTGKLLEKIPGVYHTEINDNLLTALMLAYNRWSGKLDLLLEMEGHGREECIGDFDLSRTVGWFTTLFPVHLTLDRSPGEEPSHEYIAHTIKSIKEQQRRIPHKGIGYGILRYLARNPGAALLKSAPSPALSFNYLGQLDTDLNESDILKQAKISSGSAISPENQGIHPLEIDCVVVNGELNFFFSYSGRHFDEKSIISLSENLKNALKTLVDHCLCPESGGYTPSDFPMASLSQEATDRLARDGDIESIYDLSPLQEGILFHALLSPDSSQYVNQTYWTFVGKLDMEAFKKAWKELLDNHSIFRTAFAWKDLEKPVQVLHRSVPLPWRYLDWSRYSGAARGQKFRELLTQDRLSGFDMEKPCLARLCLVRFNEDTYRFLWTDHHILTDGWCVPLLLTELFERYGALTGGRRISPEKPPEYINYIAWLKARDRGAAEDFWKNYLKGVKKPAIPGFTRKNTVLDIHKSTENMKEVTVSLPEELSRECVSFTQKNRITVNSLVQTAWAAILSVYGGGKDILMGTVVSVRPEDLEGVEKMMGLFINSLPLRIDVEDNISALEQATAVQEDIRKLGEFGYLSLSDIQECSEVPSKDPLFYSLFVFENYPFDSENLEISGLKITDFESIEKANFPLSVIVFPGKKIVFKSAFDGDCFDECSVSEVLGDLRLMLKMIIDNPGKTLNEITAEFEKNAYSAIVKAGDSRFYPCTPLQKKIYFWEQIPGIGTADNLTCVLELKGGLDLSRLSMALDGLVSENSILRTSFDTVDGEPVQRIAQNARLRKVFEERIQGDLESVMGDFVAPFDIAKAPLMRAKLVKIDKDRYYLVMDFHRIICDDYSAEILVDRLMDIYSGSPGIYSPLEFRDYSSWLDKSVKFRNSALSEKFWLENLAGEIPVLDIIPDRNAKESAPFEGGRVEVDLDDILSGYGGRREFGIPEISAAALNIMLGNMAGQTDIIIGYHTAGRNMPETKGMPGQFENILPLLIHMDNDKSVQDLLVQVSSALNGALENRSYPGDLLYEKLNLNRNAQRDPLFDVVLKITDRNPRKYQVDHIRVDTLPFRRDVSNYYLVFDVSGDGAGFSMEYRKGIFSGETAERIATYFKNTIREVIRNRNRKIHEIDFIPRSEKLHQLYDFNDTERGCNLNVTVTELFEERAGLNPHGRAVVYKNESLTYSQLNEKGNQLARLLRDRGIGKDSLVGIYVEPSLDMITAIVGVLKAGGAYIPIDASYPGDRIEYMLSDSDAPVLLTMSSMKRDFKYEGELIFLDDGSIYSGDASNPEHCAGPSDLAYIIYTSGSTGKPKGTMIEHRALVNLVKWSIEYMEINNCDNVAKFASFGFDASVIEIFPCLIAGAALHIIGDDIKLSIGDLNDYFEENNITISVMPTQFGEQFIEISDNRSLRYLTLGGDELKNCGETGFVLCNGYGPTEYTVCTSLFRVEGKYEKVPIGKPIFNTKIYILDDNNRLKPLGSAGELCVAGAGLGRGYLNRPDLTGAKFVDNPFEKGGKMYRTGDIARWLPDGNLEFLGRKDFQVKIRGYRIELGEIEQALKKHKDVKDAVVVAKTDESGNKYLCGYFVSSDEIEHNELTGHLSAGLPPYMIPQYLIRLPEMPLTPNGKVDRKNLPDPAVESGNVEGFCEPSTKNEIEIADAWKAVLGLDRISVNDNFFELGGHSIKAVTLAARLQKQYEITVADIFKYQTVGELAKNIKESRDFLKTKLEHAKAFFCKMAGNRISRSFPLKTELEEYGKRNAKYEHLNLEEVKVYSNILLAGATGFRGTYLLRKLLTSTDGVIYVPVRGNNRRESQQRLKDRLDYYFGKDFHKTWGDRIVVLCADLLKPNFDLPEPEYRELTEKIECVFQCASYLKHYGNYEDYYNGNVATTRSLIDFALEGLRKDFNLISTISIAEGKRGAGSPGLFSEYELDMGQKADDSYSLTRFEAEKMVDQARKNGLYANIFRLGLVTLDYNGGVLQKNIEDTVFFQKVKAYLNLGMVPDYLDVEPATFVDYAAEAVTLLFNRKSLMNENHHIINNKYLKLSEILTDPQLGANMEKLDINTFIGHLEKDYGSESMKKYVEILFLHWGLLSNVSIEEYFENMPEIAVDRTNMILKRLGFEWAEFEPGRMRNILVKSLEERIDFLSSLRIFSGLARHEIEDLALMARAEVCFEDEEILSQGQPNDKLYLIESGNVSVSRNSSSGWLGTIRILGKGGLFGEESIAGVKESSLLVETLFGESVVLSFRNRDILKYIGKHPELGTGLIGYLCEKASVLESLVVNMG